MPDQRERQPRQLLRRSDKLFECWAIDVFHDDEEFIFFFKDCADRDDILVDEFGLVAGLALKPLWIVLDTFGGFFEVLDGNGKLHLQVCPTVDHRLSTFSKDGVDTVVLPQCLAEPGVLYRLCHRASFSNAQDAFFTEHIIDSMTGLIFFMLALGPTHLKNTFPFGPWNTSPHIE